MEMMNDVERQFRALHEDSVRGYMAQVKHWKNRLDEQRKLAQADEAEIRESLKKSGVDLDLLDRRAQRAVQHLNERLKTTRPGLVGRSAAALEDRKLRSIESSLLAESCRPQITPYAASLIVHDLSVLDGIEVAETGSDATGGGWIFPSNPGQIRIKDSDSGDGWGCWATAYPPAPVSEVWFTFIPDRTARWELSPIFTFHGFTVMRADDGIFTCKSSEVELKATVDIFQYFWKGAKKFELLHVEKDDVDREDFFDRTEWLFDTTALRAGDRVWVKVGISVGAYASGGGSYAEINFADGAANYIEPLFMTAQVV